MSEKCIIAAVKLKKKNIDIDYQMAELFNLVEAAGGEVISSIIQERERVDNKYYFGKGKIDELKAMAEELEAETVVINNELSPAQIKNISDIIDVKIIDRT